MERENLDPTRLIWLGLLVLAGFGIAAVMLKPPEYVEETATPGPSPEVASLQCLDGKTFRSIDELSGQPNADGFPTRGYWTVTFAEGRYVFDVAGVHEAGRYRCDGSTIYASSPLASHKGQLHPDGEQLAWDGQGFVLGSPTPGGSAPQTPSPPTTSTSG